MRIYHTLQADQTAILRTLVTDDATLKLMVNDNLADLTRIRVKLGDQIMGTDVTRWAATDEDYADFELTTADDSHLEWLCLTRKQAMCLDIEYDTLADAHLVTGDDSFTEGPVEIWYWKPEHGRDYLLSFGNPARLGQNLIPSTVADLERTHIKLGSMKDYQYLVGLAGYFDILQGDTWSPTGEARALIEKLGLSHTSMSTGDCIVTADKKIYMVGGVGFVQLSGF